MPPISQRWSECVLSPGTSRRNGSLTLGVLPGEGVGPEVIACAVEVLQALQPALSREFDIRWGGAIGHDAEREHGKPLSDDVAAFCAGIVSAGGAVLNGPGGGRYVYDLRKHLDLFFKITPLQVVRELRGACRLKPAAVEGTEMLLVRENVGGIYQGNSREGRGTDGRRQVEHSFTDDEPTVRRFLSAAARLAGMRRGEMTVVCKASGVPGISALWRDCANDVAAESGIRCSMMDVDHMAYRLIQHPREFDVVAAPNLCGDVLADLGAVLLGSRGVSFSGNFAPDGAAVYQTNHGAAYDLMGTDRANPAGQILSLAMALRESFGLGEAASWIEQAMRSVWAAGWRTEDIAEPGCTVIGTSEMGRRIADTLAETVESRQVAA
jgi:3-isopropylmalate dehydrogenase